MYVGPFGSAVKRVKVRATGRRHTADRSFLLPAHACCVTLPPHHLIIPHVLPACLPQNLSLFSCACAVAAGPIILGLDTSGATLMAKGSIVATLASFGVFTTGLVSVLEGV